MPGFESNRFIDLSEREAKHLICGICLNIYDNAVRSECEHTFCKSCVQQWIEDNHKECPECREEFPTRKRSNDTRNENNLVLIGNHVFRAHLLANSMISELTIKCDFESNGCQQTVKLESLSTHVKVCEHRICENCEFIFGKTEEHNCLELLKNNRNELKDKNEKQSEIIDKLKKENSKFEAKLNVLSIGQSICPSVEYTVIGSYKTSINGIEMDSTSIKLLNIPPNIGFAKFKYHLIIPFNECQQLMYCNDPSLQTIIIKPDSSSSKKIRDTLCLSDNSPNEHKFDINSNDPKQSYILVVFNKSEAKLFNLFIRILESFNHGLIKEIDEKLAKSMVEASVNTSVNAINIEFNPNLNKQ